MSNKELVAAITAAQAEHHNNPTAENATKVKVAQNALHSFLLDGAMLHEGFSGIVALKRESKGGRWEIGGVFEGKHCTAIGETREEAVENWNKKVFI